MCEFFAVSGHHPTVVRMALHEFQQDGGNSAKNSAGWGIALYENNDAHIIREPEATSESEHMDFLCYHGCASRNIVAHIRQAMELES